MKLNLARVVLTNVLVGTVMSSYLRVQKHGQVRPLGTKTATNVTVTITIFIEVFNNSVPINSLSPGFDIALDKLPGILPDNINILYEYIRPLVLGCVRDFVGVMAAEMHYTRNVSVFVGPGCSQTLQVLSPMAALWNLPVVTGNGIAGYLENKNIHSTLTRTMFSFTAVADVAYSLMVQFQWFSLALVVNPGSALAKPFHLSILQKLEEENLFPKFAEAVDDQEEIDSALKAISETSRGESP